MNDKIEVKVGDTWERKRNGKRVVITDPGCQVRGGTGTDVIYRMENGKEGYTWLPNFHDAFRFVSREDPNALDTEPYPNLIRYSNETLAKIVAEAQAIVEARSPHSAPLSEIAESIGLDPEDYR